jgi:hypothetical protein
MNSIQVVIEAKITEDDENGAGQGDRVQHLDARRMAVLRCMAQESGIRGSPCRDPLGVLSYKGLTEEAEIIVDPSTIC